MSVSWPGFKAQLIVVTSGSGQVILKVPVRFLEQGGVLSWSYILYIISICVTDDGHLTTSDSEFVSGTPVAGTYIFATRPAGKSKMKAFTGTSEGTMSNSARSSNLQTNLRTELMIRDFQCLLTNADRADCIAAHIVPISRSDIYDLLEIDFQYSVSCGLLLLAHQHTAYDKYRWSFFVQDNGDLVVHYFEPRNENNRALHGKVITRERFRVNGEEDLPNPDMIKWHYKQAIMKNLRGFNY
ncbi:hypothetical protein MNV49_002622 [Pseudohyphozyma bogoriensis]|nr:hypothetical protein MNV49_002622 [Pseudohyphozyma bogoriensis]